MRENFLYTIPKQLLELFGYSMISVCILAKNREATIAATLDSVRSFPEVVLLDTGSEDKTLAIAAGYPNVKIYHRTFSGFGPLRNEAAALAQNDWILALDSDEALSPPLLAELEQLTLDPSWVYSIPRHNFYKGKRIRGCGWSSDRVARLYHRQNARYSLSQVHESLEAARGFPLRGPIYHTPYLSTEEFLAKMQHYSTLFAQEHRNHRRSSLGKALLHGAFAFLRSYFLRYGIVDGKEGLQISIYNANTTFYKYLKLAETNQNLPKR